MKDKIAELYAQSVYNSPLGHLKIYSGSEADECYQFATKILQLLSVDVPVLSKAAIKELILSDKKRYSGWPVAATPRDIKIATAQRDDTALRMEARHRQEIEEIWEVIEKFSLIDQTDPKQYKAFRMNHSDWQALKEGVI